MATQAIRFETHDDHRDGISCTMSVSLQFDRSWIFTWCPSAKVTLCIKPSCAWPAVNIAEHLTKILTERGCSFTATAEKEMFLDVKEKPSYFGLVTTQSSNRLWKLTRRRPFELSDRNIISVGAERFHCVDVCSSQVSSAKKPAESTTLSFQYNTKCDADIRKNLCANVKSSGGTATFQWTGEHIMKNLTALAPSTMRIIKVVF